MFSTELSVIRDAVYEDRLKSQTVYVLLTLAGSRRRHFCPQYL